MVLGLPSENLFFKYLLTMQVLPTLASPNITTLNEVTSSTIIRFINIKINLRTKYLNYKLLKTMEETDIDEMV